MSSGILKNAITLNVVASQLTESLSLKLITLVFPLMAQMGKTKRYMLSRGICKHQMGLGREQGWVWDGSRVGVS
jgi:hypothetical protein